MKSLFLIGLLLLGFSASFNATPSFVIAPQANEIFSEAKMFPDIPGEAIVKNETSEPGQVFTIVDTLGYSDVIFLILGNDSKGASEENVVTSVLSNPIVKSILYYDSDVGWQSKGLLSTLNKEYIYSTEFVYRRAREGILCLSSAK